MKSENHKSIQSNRSDIDTINSTKTEDLVKTKYFESEAGITLQSGRTLSPLKLAYETRGTLNQDKSNAILIFHALSGDAHVSGYSAHEKKTAGWWNFHVGPEKGIDTNKYFIICANVIGGCQGSTGPSSINPQTNKPYGKTFPIITISDMVNAQKLLTDYFKIKKLFAVIGGSMGGMQALQWVINYPNT